MQVIRERRNSRELWHAKLVAFRVLAGLGLGIGLALIILIAGNFL